MITRVQVKNYRSLADVDVRLGPLTVLVGRNGTGKSAFLDVLRFVRDAIQQGLESAINERQGITAIRRWTPRKPCDVEITLTVEGDNFHTTYSFVISSGRQGSYRVKRESFVGKDREGNVEEFETKDGKWIIMPPYIKETSLSGFPFVKPAALVLPSVSLFLRNAFLLLEGIEGSFYNIIPDKLREPQKPSDERRLMDDGSNLASILRRIKESRMWFPTLLTALGKVSEGVNGLRVSRIGGYLVTELRHENIGKKPDANNNAPWFPLAQESDGTLRMLAMLVALYQSEPPYAQTLLGLEEPENALHPGALAVLSDVFREAALRNQIIITTQSPDLISHFTVDELRIVEIAQGVTKIGPIDETQREIIEEELFSASDLLRIQDLRREPVEAR
ncbi:MAG: AAA family ATPase [Acidobacteriota bacterium]